MTGVALISGYITFIILIPVSFIVMYHFLIKREEEFLRNEFGKPYEEYCKTTPRLFPNLKHYQAPESIDVRPEYLNKAFKDAIWWFAAFPLLEFAETLQEHSIIDPLFMLP